MNNEQIISLEECCKAYSIETTFVTMLSQSGIISLSEVNQRYYIDSDQLTALEKYAHMHYELDINIEGIEAISHLLNRIESLQKELQQLKG